MYPTGMEKRACTRCGVVKGSHEFEANGKKPDGSVRLRSICKSCGSGRRAVNPEGRVCTICGEYKEAHEYHRRGRICGSCQNEQSYEYKRGPGRAVHNKRMVEYQRRKYRDDPQHREKVKARSAVNYAVHTGHLRKPTTCPRCGRSVVVHGHHHNGYDPEHWLDVVWLCAKCHREEEGAV